MSFSIDPSMKMFEGKKILHSNDSLNYLIFEKDYALAPIIFDEKLLNESVIPLSQREIINDSDSIYSSNIIIISTESEILRKHDLQKTDMTSSCNEITNSF
jgi:hypothetical protein